MGEYELDTFYARFSNKIEKFFENRAKRTNKPYGLILCEFDEFKKYLPEVKKLREEGYEHFKVKETEEKILKIIEEDERVLTKQNLSGCNIGMMAAELGLENVVLRSLDNEEASLQQDEYGYNIGMYSAMHKLEKATIKALNNEKASLQQEKICDMNIGMISARYGLEKATLKALDNKKACLQKCSEGFNI